MTTSTNIITGQINAAGEAALIEWLRGNLREPGHAEAFARDIVANIDGAYAEEQGMSTELRGLHSKDGNPKVYQFGKAEYDLVTYNEDGDEISRRIAG